MRFVVSDASTVDWDVARAGGQIGKFQLLSEVGIGAFGRVFKARDVELDRIVAIKVPRADGPGGWVADESRFLREGRSVAQLRHASIVAVHHVGHHNGLPYLVEDFVDGVTLSDLLTSRPVSVRESTELVARVAEALQYAHDCGVVHRDVKPSNILLSNNLEPYLTDFGLAKRDVPELTLTRDGEPLGTPAYMSPEQARGQGHGVDGRSDVYSLGVVLYQLLTGELPFRGNSRMVLHQVLQVEPRPPRILNDHIPRDAETICLRAMAKEPERRYARAGDLAEDLRRFLRNEPIKARPSGRGEKVWRWSRRNPAVASLVAAVAMLFVTLAIGTILYAAHQHAIALKQTQLARERTQFGLEKEGAYKDLSTLHRRTQADLYRALMEDAAALRYARQPGYRARVWECLKRATVLDVAEKAPADIRAKAIACLGDWVGLDPEQESTFRPQVPVPPTPALRDVIAQSQASSPALNFEVSPDGKLVVVAGSADAPALVVLNEAGERLGESASPVGSVHVLAVSGDGQTVVGGCEEGAAIWSLPSLKLRMFFRGNVVNSVAIHPGGGVLATANLAARIEIWSIQSHQCIASIQTGAPHGQLRIAFSKDGDHLLALAGAKVIGAWRVMATPEKRYLAGHSGGVTAVEFSSDSQLLASCSKDGSVRIWDAVTGALVRVIEPERGAPRPAVQTLAFDPTSSVLATGDFGGNLRLYDARTALQLAEFRLPPSGGGIWRVRFDLGGTCVLASGTGGLTVWSKGAGTSGGDWKNAEVVTSLPGRFFRDAAFTPDGSGLAYLDTMARHVCLYDIPSGSTRQLPHVAIDDVGQLNFAANEPLLTFGTSDRSVGLWDWQKAAVRRVTRAHFYSPLVAVTPDVRWLASKFPDRRLAIYDLLNDEEVVVLPPENSEIWWASWSPDRNRVALGLADGGLVVWDLEQVKAKLGELDISIPSTSFIKSVVPRGTARD